VDPVEFRFRELIGLRPGECVVRRQTGGVVFESALETQARNLRIKNLVIVGFAASACVEGTLNDAPERIYWLVMPHDCSAAVECHDFLEDQKIARSLVRHLVAFLGCTATSEEYIRFRNRIRAGIRSVCRC
jgi:nicotinamidase-related amidase